MPLTRAHLPARWRAVVPRVALVLLLALAFVLLTGLLDGGVGVSPPRMFDQARYPLANAWPGLLLALVLLVASRRAVLSFALAFLLQGLLYAANVLKKANLGTPLLPEDFRIVGQLRKGGLHILSGYLPHSPWPYLGALAAVALIVAAWRLEPPLFPRRTRGLRLLGGSVLALALASLLAGRPVWSRVYNANTLWLEPWSAISTATHSGLVSSLMLFHLEYNKGERKPDRAAATQLIEQSTPALLQSMRAPATGGELPDIVVVQSESFFDPAIMRGYEHSNFTPNLRRLAAHGTSGALHVPTFGGGTIRTEFEVLTGLSLRYFDNLQFPYLQMGHKPLPGLVRALGRHGYSTLALHGNDPAFWNRTAAFKMLGFDRFVSQSSFPHDAPNDGKYMADSAMTGEIMAQLKDHGPPQFIFAISIEAHGPYDVEPAHAAERDAIPVPAGIEGRDKLELQTYLYHLKHADAELGRLVELLAQRQRPSVVLFYGDHLPALSNSYRTTGFVDGGDMLNQAGVWLLVDPKHPGQRAQVDTAAWLLPGKLLAHVGIHDDAYFALTELVGPQLAVLTEAPGAPPLPEGDDQRQLDAAMGSVGQLRMRGKLDRLLPQPPEPSPANVAHNDEPPTSPPAGAMLFDAADWRGHRPLFSELSAD
ncbi:LTA synthase family protein [Rhodanobacter denitrificans]|uniref:LTA synthase family protein n=1 Tax=Rhodanobacter denitrificans TaxID=666685 RepID=A0A368KEU7_9GAMM|nr:LTA synthase family protein [Rhodanobacter denitrificans]RCS29223.1 LTA synthase family protein [Rhodanobacter denitrificans]